MMIWDSSFFISVECLRTITTYFISSVNRNLRMEMMMGKKISSDIILAKRPWYAPHN